MIIGNYNLRAFVLTLQEMPEKEKFIQAHFRERGIEAESFNCMSAADSGLRTVHPYEFDAPGSGWNIGPKGVANWVSQYMLWSAMNVLPDTHFWQLEWDCNFPENWRKRTEAALRDVPPDFDMLFIGSCCCKDAKKTFVAGEIFNVTFPLCSHSMIIAKKALPTILHTQRKVYAPMDISLNFHSMRHLKVYTVLPRICTQFDTVIPP